MATSGLYLGFEIQVVHTDWSDGPAVELQIRHSSKVTLSTRKM